MFTQVPTQCNTNWFVRTLQSHLDMLWLQANKIKKKKGGKIQHVFVFHRHNDFLAAANPCA